jgi:hypothetical protein
MFKVFEDVCLQRVSLTDKFADNFLHLILTVPVSPGV